MTSPHAITINPSNSKSKSPIEPKPNQPARHPKTKPSTSPTDPSSITITVHNLTAKVSLNRPEEDLLPSRYLRKADRSSVVSKIIWPFRDNVEDAREVDLEKWSKIDIRYRGVFNTLAKVPEFKNGLYEDVPVGLTAVSVERAERFQDQVVYALLNEVLEMVDLRRWVVDDEVEGFFFLRPRLISLRMDYLTGYRERHKDAPATAGFLALDFDGGEAHSRMILPVSTTKEKESLNQALTGKFKQMLGQLIQHIRYLCPPGDKLPDQEVFLIGLHGSRLHILRAFFPGRKSSFLWCGCTDPVAPEDPLSPPAATSPRFYRKENIDRLMGGFMYSASDSPGDDPEPDNLRTFRVIGTREYDLWLAADFKDAVRMLVGLCMYLMSGKAKCGFLQKTFEQYPFEQGSEAESDGELERRQERAVREQMELVLREKRLERSERKERKKAREHFCNREARRSIISDRIGGFDEAGKEGWNWVWEDKKMDPTKGKEDEEDVILNDQCMSGRPV